MELVSPSPASYLRFALNLRFAFYQRPRCLFFALLLEFYFVNVCLPF